jgi:hypothetical protein
MAGIHGVALEVGAREGANEMKKQAEFPDMSAGDRTIVGSPSDYDWDNGVTLPARARPEMVQFSLRLERDLYERFQALAERDEVSFSDVVRSALRSFVRSGGGTGVANFVVSYGEGTAILVQSKQRAVVSANRRGDSVVQWTNDQWAAPPVTGMKLIRSA